MGGYLKVRTKEGRGGPSRRGQEQEQSQEVGEHFKCLRRLCFSSIQTDTQMQRSEGGKMSKRHNSCWLQDNISNPLQEGWTRQDTIGTLSASLFLENVCHGAQGIRGR